MAPGKTTELNDGLFEVTLIKRPKDLIELNLILAALVNEKVNTDFMYSFKTSKLKITSRKQVAWTLDGEFGGKLKEIEIENLNKALEIIVPKDKK